MAPAGSHGRGPRPPPRPGRGGLPGRDEMVLRPAGRRRAQISLRQRRRRRAGDVQGPLHPRSATPTPPRRHAHRGLRRGHPHGLHLCPRRVRPRSRGGSRRPSPRPAARGIPRAGASSERFGLEIVVHRGAGAYICGEETALLESLEGRRGRPRLKPPFPAVVGLFRPPTVINNVETLATVPQIIGHGRGWFLGRGRPKDGGTRLFGVSGAVRRPGVYELAVGTPLRETHQVHAGGPPEGRTHQGRHPRRAVRAGPQGRTRSTSPMDVDRLARAGSMLGSAGDHRHRRRRRRCSTSSAHGPVLRPRVLRQVHALPHRDGLDPQDRRAARRGRGRPGRPRPHPARWPTASRGGRSARWATRRPCPSWPWSRSSGRARAGGGPMSGTKQVGLTIDGRTVQAAEGTNVLEGRRTGGHRHPAFLLPPGLRGRRQLPDVPRRDRGPAQARAGLLDRRP